MATRGRARRACSNSAAACSRDHAGRLTSYSATADAADTLRLSMPPGIGRPASSSHVSRVSRRRPGTLGTQHERNPAFAQRIAAQRRAARVEPDHP